MGRGVPLLNESGDFIWTDERTMAATMLAEGKTKTEISEILGISVRGLYYWLNEPKFAQEVDNLSMLYGIASRAERVRMINRMAQQFVKEDGSYDISGFNLLDLLKEARMQTEGINLNVLSKLTALDAEVGLVESRGTITSSGLLPEEIEEAE